MCKEQRSATPLREPIKPGPGGAVTSHIGYSPR